jgi:hypothetical protein
MALAIYCEPRTYHSHHLGAFEHGAGIVPKIGISDVVGSGHRCCLLGEVGKYEDQQPYIITVNGEAKAVLQDVRSYEMMQEQLAMLTIVIQGQQDIAEGKVVPLDEAMSNIQRKYAKNTSRKA